MSMIKFYFKPLLIFSKKKTFLLIFLLITFSSIYCQNKQKIISILYFNNNTKKTEWDWFERGICDMLITDIDSSKEITVLEREEIQKIFEEQNFSHSDEVSDEKAIEIGNLLSANKLVAGSFTIFNNNMRIDAKIIDTETGVAEGVKIEGDINNLFSLEEMLANKILMNLHVQGNLYKESESLEAVRAYYQGEILLESGEVDLAMAKFQTSSELDPLYGKAQKGIAEAFKFLKDFRKFRYQREIQKLYDKIVKFKKRLNENPFRTYADLIKSIDFNKMSDQQREQFNKKYEVYLLAQTPAQCYWGIQNTLNEIYYKKLEYLDEKNDKLEEELNEAGKEKELDVLEEKHEKERKSMESKNLPLIQEIINIANIARKKLKNDSFLQEVLYNEILALSEMKNYKLLKSKCEELMMNYPDYRMMEFVEDFYEDSLKELKKNKADR